MHITQVCRYKEKKCDVYEERVLLKIIEVFKHAHNTSMPLQGRRNVTYRKKKCAVKGRRKQEDGVRIG